MTKKKRGIAEIHVHSLPRNPEPSFTPNGRKICIMEVTVLDGEVAVPCGPQSAPVGSNSLPRLPSFWPVPGHVALKAGALREGPPANPVRTGR